MSSSLINYHPYRSFVLFMCLLAGSASFAGRGAYGGGFHQGDDGYHQDNLYHQNDGYVGNYRPGAGYVAPVILDAGNEDVNCQSVQQCDSDGTCIQTQNCN